MFAKRGTSVTTVGPFIPAGRYENQGFLWFSCRLSLTPAVSHNLSLSNGSYERQRSHLSLITAILPSKGLSYRLNCWPVYERCHCIFYIWTKKYKKYFKLLISLILMTSYNGNVMKLYNKLDLNSVMKKYLDTVFLTTQ